MNSPKTAHSARIRKHFLQINPETTVRMRFIEKLFELHTYLKRIFQTGFEMCFISVFEKTKNTI